MLKLSKQNKNSYNIQATRQNNENINHLTGLCFSFPLREELYLINVFLKQIFAICHHDASLWKYYDICSFKFYLYDPTNISL